MNHNQDDRRIKKLGMDNEQKPKRGLTGPVHIIPAALNKIPGMCSENWEDRVIFMSELVDTLNHGEPGRYILYPDPEKNT